MYSITPTYNILLIFEMFYLDLETAFSTQVLLCLSYVLDRIYPSIPFSSFILCGMKNPWNVILVHQISINSTTSGKFLVGFSADLQG